VIDRTHVALGHQAFQIHLADARTISTVGSFLAHAIDERLLQLDRQNARFPRPRG
jgi:hypothetical protein